MEKCMNPYRTARNQTLAALSAADNVVHLTTEAALDSEAGIVVDKAALLASLVSLNSTIGSQIALAMGTITNA